MLLATASSALARHERSGALEQAVSLVASLVRHFHRERRPFLFGAPGLVTEVFNRAEMVHVCLAWLATVRADERYRPEAILREVGSRRLRGTDVILVSPGEVQGSEIGTKGFRLHHVGAASREGRALLRWRK